MKIAIPNLSLVVLIGTSGSGKSTFARKHFKPTEILSSDFYRGLVADDENDQSATSDAFDVLHYIAAKRLAAGRLTVVDATNVQPEARKPLIELARQYHVIPVAIVLDLPERVCQDRNRTRPDRDFGPHVIARQRRDLHRSLRGLQREGLRHVFVLDSLDKIEAATIERQPLWNDRRTDHGPFDIIGDVHGCYDELVALLEKLGYDIAQTDGAYTVTPPDGRKAVFLGDLVDRGPKTPDVLRLVMAMVAAGAALCVPGNHESKLLKKLRGRNVQITHGLAETLEQLERETPEFRKDIEKFIDSLISHYVLDDGKLVVAHAGMKEAMQGRGSAKVRDFALYGETTGETDEYGLPVRYNWAAEYRGTAMVVYGHTPTPSLEWLNRTICIDTGCVFGGTLTALRYPEREIVSVQAAQMYYAPAKPFLPEASENRATPTLTAQQANDDVLDIADVTGKRIIGTRLAGNVTVREENAIAALEVMSRFAADPKWLIYLPPTMSPSETSALPDLLEHPAEAFAYYRNEGIAHVVCEEKHMGSRAVAIVCRDAATAQRRFGVVGDALGIVYTRTGRRFFDDTALEGQFVGRLRAALDRSGLWDDLKTDWVCLDCELMPWSAKAQGLIRNQYAAVGAAATMALSDVQAALAQASAHGQDVSALAERYTQRAILAEQYRAAYRHYTVLVNSLDDLTLAPFHILATEGATHTDKNHIWHMDTLARLAQADAGMIVATPYTVIDVTNPESVATGIAWWQEFTGRGGEGMVVKPLDFIAKGRRGIVQPAVKCRGREYLRIIYGPEYTLPDNIERLRSRGVSAKRSLAWREFALGIEALERFARHEPLRRVHECVFGVLALESEPVDSRL